jgi:hypothetical protein
MNFRFFPAAIACLLSIPLFAQAKPYNAEQVPATAQWIIHVDIDALKDSGIGREISRIKDVNVVVKFVIQRMDTLHSILLFGAQFSSNHAVLLINGEFNVAANQIEVEFNNENARGVYYSRELLIMGHDNQENAAAIKVLDHKAPALQKDSPLAAPGLKNTLFLCAAINPKNISMLQKEPWPSIIDNMNDASISVRMNKNDIQAQALLTATSDDIASKVEIALKGLQAILKLKGIDPGDPMLKTAVDLFAKAHIDSNDAKITIDMKIPLKDLISVLSKTVPETVKEPLPSTRP